MDDSFFESFLSWNDNDNKNIIGTFVKGKKSFLF